MAPNRPLERFPVSTDKKDIVVNLKNRKEKA